jgi:rhodanese-related sulfurtransferase
MLLAAPPMVAPFAQAKTMQNGRSQVVLASALAVAALMAATLAAGLSGAGEARLSAVEARVERLYPGVAQIDAAALVAELAGPEALRPVLVDVREEAEFAVSRIAGAVRVAPSAEPAEVIAALGESVAGRKVVFYCSVGMRSSALAGESAAALAGRGATQVLNLRGGIFGWHNRSLPLVDASGATSFVHPYDERWGRLLLRKDLARY